jgi:hypothetical protein
LIDGYLRTVELSNGDVADAKLAVSPAVEIAWLKDAGAQTLGKVTLAGEGARLTFAMLEPVARSELLRDLEALRS